MRHKGGPRKSPINALSISGYKTVNLFFGAAVFTIMRLTHVDLSDDGVSR
jgi:hypothetical protein